MMDIIFMVIIYLHLVVVVGGVVATVVVLVAAVTVPTVYVVTAVMIKVAVVSVPHHKDHSMLICSAAFLTSNNLWLCKQCLSSFRSQGVGTDLLSPTNSQCWHI